MINISINLDPNGKIIDADTMPKISSQAVLVSVLVTNNSIMTTNVVTVSQEVLKLYTNKLGELSDVDSSAKADGDTLVYVGSLDKYVVEKLDANNVLGLDGGNF